MKNFVQNISRLIEKNTLFYLFFLVLIAVFIRLYGLSQWFLNHDENWHLFVASFATHKEVFFNNFIYDGHPPLMYHFWHEIYQKFGENHFLLRLPSVIFSVLLIPLGHFLAIEIFNKKSAGDFFAIMSCFCSLFIEQSVLLRGYSAALFFATTALYFSIVFYKNQKIYQLFLHYVFILLAFLTEFAIINFAVFTGLIICKAIINRKKEVFILHVLNIAFYLLLLLYIYYFTQILSFLGGIEGVERERENNDIDFLRSFFVNIIFFTQALNVFNFYKHYNSFIDLLAAFIFSLTIITCIIYSVKEGFFKNKYIFIFFIGYLFITAILDYLGKIPYLERRWIGFSIPVFAIFYIGLCAINQCLKLPFKYNRAIVLFTIVLMVFLPAITLRYNNEINYELYIKTTEVSEIKNFIEDNSNKNDVIFIDWLSFIFLSKEKKYYELDYRIRKYNYYGKDSFVFKGENRFYTSIMSLYDVKNSLKFINDKKHKNVILIGFKYPFGNVFEWLGDVNKGNRNSKSEINKFNKQTHEVSMEILKRSESSIMFNYEGDKTNKLNKPILAVAIKISVKNLKNILKKRDLINKKYLVDKKL